MKFDPNRSKSELEEYVINAMTAMTLEEALHKQCLGNSGSITLGAGIECLVVGLFDIGKEVVNTSLQRLRLADEIRESSHPGRATVLHELAFAHWLQSGHEDTKALDESVDCRETWFDECKSIDKVNVQLSLAPYIEAKRYETIIHRYESSRLTPPKNIRRIQGEGTMCYVMARQRLGLDYTTEEVEAALNTFIKRRIGDWMEGLYTTAARWMKIAHWKPGDDPIATILRVYDYLPELEPPKYPPDVKTPKSRSQRAS
jgi:hypothetical protein